MNEAPLATPIHITGRVYDMAQRQEHLAYIVNEAELTRVFDDTGRTELNGAAAITIGASKPFGGDLPSAAVLDGRFLAPSGGKHSKKVRSAGESVDPDALKGRTPIHLQVAHDQPITNAGFAQKLAETLSVPARARNTVRRVIGTLSVSAGGLTEIPAFAKYWMDDGEFTPGTLLWMIAGGVAIVGGGVLIASGHKHAQRINTAEQRAALRTPIVIRSRHESQE